MVMFAVTRIGLIKINLPLIAFKTKRFTIKTESSYQGQGKF